MLQFPLRRLVAASLAVFCACAFAQRDPGRTVGGQMPQIAKDSAVKNVVAMVYDGKVGYVRIETRERDAPLNQHPVAIDPATLRALLNRALMVKDKKPVLSSEQLDEIVVPLSQALARALPEQDVSFAVSGQHDLLGPLAPRNVTTGRLFYADNRMNVIFGLVRQDWESQYRATAYLIPFEPGKRTLQVDKTAQVTAAGGAVVRRADWVELDPLAPPPAVAKPEQAPTPPPAVVIPSVTPAPDKPSAAVPAPAPSTAATPAPVTPAPAAPAAPSAQPPADGDVMYRQVSERLKALQKLRDAGAITEEEYQQKRREILKAL